MEQILHYYLRVLNKLLFYLLIFIILIFSYFFYFLNVKNILKDEVIFDIKKGTSLNNISEIILSENNYLEKKFYLFYLYFWNNYIEKVNFGEFKIDKKNLIEITKIISKPSNVYRKFIIIGGWQEFQIQDKLFDNLHTLIDSNYDEVLADTYFYQSTQSSKEIYKYMTDLKNSFFKRYSKNHLLKKYTHNQLLTIASLIEKEAIDDDDKRLVSSVIFNRLKRNMKLQIDATTIFSITKGKFKLNRKLLIKDLKIKDIYNTYYIRGLPPSPICFVSKKTIEIVLEDYKSEYLFYFYNQDLKKHVYSKTFDQHKIKLNKYRKNK